MGLYSGYRSCFLLPLLKLCNTAVSGSYEAFTAEISLRILSQKTGFAEHGDKRLCWCYCETFKCNFVGGQGPLHGRLGTLRSAEKDIDNIYTEPEVKVVLDCDFNEFARVSIIGKAHSRIKAAPQADHACDCLLVCFLPRHARLDSLLSG